MLRPYSWLSSVILLFTSLCSIALAGNNAALTTPVSGTPPAYQLEALSIATAEGEQTFQVEVARTPAQKQQGLMFRQHLPAKQGMLFLYTPPRAVNMWMKNTYIALDILFIDPQGQISHQVANTQPLSKELIASDGPVRAVLELPAGSIARYRLEVGQAVSHPAMTPSINPSAAIVP